VRFERLSVGEEEDATNFEEEVVVEEHELLNEEYCVVRKEQVRR
jgi:hypothetical protein